MLWNEKQNTEKTKIKTQENRTHFCKIKKTKIGKTKKTEANSAQKLVFFLKKPKNRGYFCAEVGFSVQSLDLLLDHLDYIYGMYKEYIRTIHKYS